MASLILTTPEGQKAVTLAPTNSLGRHPSNSIQLLDKIVSKEHCLILGRGEHFVLRDLGSLNGTFINRERVYGERTLQHGDEIAMGQTKARFDASPAPAHAPHAGVQAPASWHQGAWQQQGPAPSGTPLAGVPAAAPPAYGQQPHPPVSYTAAGPIPATAQPPASNYAQQPPPPAPHPDAPPPSQRQPLPTPAWKTTARGLNTAFLPAIIHGTQVAQDDDARQIGAEIEAEEKEFLSYHELAKKNPQQLRADYERLRLSYELTRDIADESNPEELLQKILKSIFRFIPAQRGVMFLPDEDGHMLPRANYRNDGSDEPITVSTTILKKVVDDLKAVLTHDAAMDFAASKGKSMILNQIQSALVSPMLHNGELFGVLWLDSKSLAQFQPKDLQLVSAVANQAAMFIEINNLGKQVQDEASKRERLGRMLSPFIAEQVVSGEVDLKPGGTRTDCTVYNSDIRGFTSMSENTRPEELVEMLNSYFEEMVEKIFKYEGTLDKFMGDGIMALWGAPVAHDDDPVRAVECALEQVDVLGRFNRDRLANGQKTLGVGLGIHTGAVVAGYIGSSRKLEYTVIGDVANTSARLCSRAKAGQIIVSATTRSLLPSRIQVEELPPAKMKGKRHPMRIFNVLHSGKGVQVVDDLESTSSDSSEKVADTSPEGSAAAPQSGATPSTEPTPPKDSPAPTEQCS